jgi:hypothetical protein
MRGRNSHTYAYIDRYADRYASAVQLVCWAGHAYGFG